jgi:tRNA nucleotidyltransferase (CCA-adding enzyme)
LDTILLNFLQCLAGLTPKTLISWDSLYSQETLLQVLADPQLGCVLRPGWTLQGSRTDTLSQSSAGPLVLNPADPTHNLAASVSIEQLTCFVNFGQKTLNDVQHAVMCDLRRRLLQQEMKVKRLHSKLDQQSSLMQVVLANSKGPADN